MRCKILSLCLLTFAMVNLTWAGDAQEEKRSGEAQNPRDGELNRQMQERQTKIHRLPPEERASLQAALQNAASDPAVKMAMAKRDRAIQEFQAEFRASMLKADPSVAEVLKKMMAARSRPNQPR